MINTLPAEITLEGNIWYWELYRPGMSGYEYRIRISRENDIRIFENFDGATINQCAEKCAEFLRVADLDFTEEEK